MSGEKQQWKEESKEVSYSRRSGIRSQNRSQEMGESGRNSPSLTSSETCVSFEGALDHDPVPELTQREVEEDGGKRSKKVSEGGTTCACFSPPPVSE